MKKPVVFSLFRDQSVFMTTVMGLMTFLATLALGLSLSIGDGVLRWNRQWATFATVQITNPDKAASVANTLKDSAQKIENFRELTTDEMRGLMGPWISGGNDALEKYLPKMYEIKFKTESDMKTVGDLIKPNARFISHNEALKPSVSAGWKMVTILGIMLALIIGTIGICVSFIARNTALLHKRELEILNQIGASDGFVAHQMQIIVTKICLTACGMGFAAALPILAIIITVAHSARVGLMAMLGLSIFGWISLVIVPIAIIVFAIFITKRTTLKILNQ